MVTTACGHARQRRGQAGHPKPPWGELASSIASLSYPGCGYGGGLAGGSPNRAGHVWVVGYDGALRRRGHVSGYGEAVEVQVRCAR